MSYVVKHVQDSSVADRQVWTVLEVSGAPRAYLGNGTVVEVRVLKLGYAYSWRAKAWTPAVYVSGDCFTVGGVNITKTVEDYLVSSPVDIAWIWQLVRECLPAHQLSG